MTRRARHFLLTLFLLFGLTALGTACTGAEEPAAPQATPLPATAAATAAATAEPAASPTPLPAPDPLAAFRSDLEAALGARDLTAVGALLHTPFALGPYRSEWSSFDPAGARVQLENAPLAAGAAVAFSDLDETAIAALLDGMPPRAILPPDAPIAAVIHSTGWGPAAADDGVLYIYDTDDGPRWAALLYIPAPPAAEGIPYQFTEIPEIVTTADTVDFYAGPGTDYPVVAMVFGGQRYPVVGISENGSWWKLACGGDDGLFPECWAAMDEGVTPFEVSYERVAPPAGLLYNEFDVGLWQLDAALIPRLLTTRTDLFVAPSGTQGVYFDDMGQLWHVDLATGAKRQLTEDQDLNRHALWAGESAILTGVYLTPAEMDGPNSGHLARVDIADGALTVLDEERLSFGRPAVAPDGTIAYDAGGSSYLLADDGARQPFDPAVFAGWDTAAPGTLLLPAFSPDGQRLAWLAAWGDQSAIAVFDLEAETVTLLHPFDPARFGGLPPGPVWSPDGAWIAVRILANGSEGSGLWVLGLDGAVLFLGRNVGDALWLDADHVLFSHYRYDTRTTIERVDVTTGERRELDLSGRPDLVGVGGG